MAECYNVSTLEPVYELLMINLCMILLIGTQQFRVTNYTNTIEQCGNTKGITASGHKIQKGFCAANRCYSFGSIIQLDTGEYLIVADRGRIKRNQLDRAHLNGIRNYYPQRSVGRLVYRGKGKPYKAVATAIQIRKKLIWSKNNLRMWYYKRSIQKCLQLITVSLRALTLRIILMGF